MDARGIDPSSVYTHKRGGHGYERRCGREGSRPPGVDVYNRGAALPDAHNRALPAVGTAPALAKGTSNIEPTSGAAKAAATQLEALEPTATRHIHEAPTPGGEPMGKPEASPLGRVHGRDAATKG